ncbi:Transposon TX1 uncharacterized protein [Merluccius polli]|uniref:Transposon TX1 uncharacterized protein n=1 Tax=Merluccius polli TaxID=89951 RepID=A0AA47P1F6_MERPO|nr:Transposon TX1 uncharacterized protein [Merluccius polli]
MRDITKAMKALETEIVELQGLVEATGDTGHFEALSSKRALLADLLGTRAQGALVRSRFQSISQMDTPSKFFFALERKNGQSRYIHTLRAGDGTELTEPHEIRRRAVQFYSELYESEYVENDECFDSFCDGMPQISDDDHLELKAPLVGAELHAALQGMDGGKSPGLDGLPVEFYKTFWKELGQDLLEVFNESFRDLTLPLSCRRAVITLLPKKGDLTDIKNWRPVSLLCTDYKILSKALADRLRRVMDEVLHGVLKAWGLFKKTRMEHSVSLYWLLQEPLIGGSIMDIQDNGLPGLHHVLRSAGVLTLGQVVDAAGHGLMNTAALAARIGLRSVRYAQAMLNGWTERLTDADNELLRLYWEEEETPDEEDPFPDLGLLMNLEDCSGYKRNNAVKWKLLNFIVGEAKLSIYLTRRNKMEVHSKLRKGKLGLASYFHTKGVSLSWGKRGEGHAAAAAGLMAIVSVEEGSFLFEGEIHVSRPVPDDGDLKPKRDFLWERFLAGVTPRQVNGRQRTQQHNETKYTGLPDPIPPPGSSPVLQYTRPSITADILHTSSYFYYPDPPPFKLRRIYTATGSRTPTDPSADPWSRCGVFFTAHLNKKEDLTLVRHDARRRPHPSHRFTIAYKCAVVGPLLRMSGPHRFFTASGGEIFHN